jgi:hypothetical protein
MELKDIEVEQHERIDMPELTALQKEYLLKRHGTLELDPMPSQDPADPLNWPRWKVSFWKVELGFLPANSCN